MQETRRDLVCREPRTFMMTSPGLEKGTAYHLNVVLTIVFDGRPAGVAGVMVHKIKKSLSICVPLIFLETSQLFK